jgi:hypothetical protein
MFTDSEQARKEKRMYINLFYDLGFHANWKDVNGKKMLSAPEEVLLEYLDMIKEEPIYRIRVNDDGTVDTDCYDMLENFAPELNMSYDSVDSLPKWVQDKLAVLMVLDHTKQNEEVKTIGRRISKDIFWVFKGETNGDNPRG